MKICLVRVALTEQGRAQIEDWRRRKREALTDLLSVLDEDEQRNLQDMIERVLEWRQRTHAVALRRVMRDDHSY